MSAKHLSINALRGDAKVLLAFNLPEEQTANLAGFTIQCFPPGLAPYYLWNKVQFANPKDHAQLATEPAYSTINAPIQKFRWLHVPGGIHNGKVVYGDYEYVVTPRYFDPTEKLLPIDKNLSVTTKAEVSPFVKGEIELGFTRGFVQSQAFVNHFGIKAPFKPKNDELLFDTDQQAGINAKGEAFTYRDEYIWSGLTARSRIFDMLEMVLNDGELNLDVLAYDLNEPDILNAFLELGKVGRIRIVLDDAALHVSSTDKNGKLKETPEDAFTKLFARKAKKINNEKPIKRGHFRRYQHNKVFIVTRGENREPVKLLTGSTNFSVTGVYVNSNHVITFTNPAIIDKYKELFDAIWASDVDFIEFQKYGLANGSSAFKISGIPLSVTFAPHENDEALKNLADIVTRMDAEKHNILFAVMGIDATTKGPVAPALAQLHKRTNIFTCGVTDTTEGIVLYKPSSKEGILVTGKQGKTLLPPPFSEEAYITMGHQVHHKFIVCGFNTNEAVVYLGSSNLAEGGERQNGDNLVEIHDQDIATVFAIEAIALVDHFHFLNANQAPKEDKKAKKTSKKAAAKKKPALPKTFDLHTNGKWAKSYFKSNDLHCIDRMQFAKP